MNNHNDISFELMKLMHMMKRQHERNDKIIIQKIFGEEEALTSVDVMFMGFIRMAEEKEIYQKDIEEFFSLTAPTVSSKLRILEKNEMITRSYSKVDTRLKRVILTEKGKMIADKIKEEKSKVDDECVQLLTEEECRVLRNIVEKLMKEFT